MSIPKGYENDLGNYGPQIYDGDCGEPIMWGHKILSHLGDERFNNLRNFGSLECCYPHWFFITKKLTREEAIKKYGAVTDEEFGPRGGWRSVTLGKKTFMSPLLKENK